MSETHAWPYYLLISGIVVQCAMFICLGTWFTKRGSLSKKMPWKIVVTLTAFLMLIEQLADMLYLIVGVSIGGLCCDLTNELVIHENVSYTAVLLVFTLFFQQWVGIRLEYSSLRWMLTALVVCLLATLVSYGLAPSLV